VCVRETFQSLTDSNSAFAASRYTRVFNRALPSGAID